VATELKVDSQTFGVLISFGRMVAWVGEMRTSFVMCLNLVYGIGCGRCQLWIFDGSADVRPEACVQESLCLCPLRPS